MYICINKFRVISLNLQCHAIASDVVPRFAVPLRNEMIVIVIVMEMAMEMEEGAKQKGRKNGNGREREREREKERY